MHENTRVLAHTGVHALNAMAGRREETGDVRHSREARALRRRTTHAEGTRAPCQVQIHFIIEMILVDRPCAVGV